MQPSVSPRTFGPTAPSSDLPCLVNVADDIAQANYIVETILANREASIRLKSQAVLFRTSHHSATLEVELTRRNIPFVKFGGLKFLEAAHIKDVLATLRWANNLRDRVSGFRVAQLLPGIGPGSAAQSAGRYSGKRQRTAGLEGFRPPAATAEHWQDLRGDMTCCISARAGWPAEIDSLPVVCAASGAHIRRRHCNDKRIWCSSHKLLRPTPRERFLTELTLDPPDATSDQAGPPLLDEDYLILSTIHSAKGQEWNAVFVLNAVDGCIPSDLGVGTTHEIEEERRLLYVAMTRAKDQLHVMVPQKFYTHGQRAMGGRHVYAQRTRFIPNSVSDHFCKVAPGHLRTL